MKSPDRMNVKLTQGMDEDKKERFIQEYKNSRKVLLRIRQILEDEIQKSYVDEENVDNIDTVKIANTFGYRRGVRKALNYLPEE